MRVLLVTARFEPDSGASSARFTQLAQRLAARGHTTTVLTALPHYPHGRIAAGYRGVWSQVEVRERLRIVRVWLWATPSPRVRHKLLSQLTFMVNVLLRGLRVARPDVVLIEMQPVPTGLAGVLLARWLRAPYVLNVSDLWPDHLLSVSSLGATHPIYRMTRWVVDRMYRGAAAILAASPLWTRKIVARMADKAPALHTQYFMVDLQRLRPDVSGADFRARHGLQDCKVVACIGTFATQYDMETLLATARQLEAREDLRFVIIGDGTQRAKLRQAGANVQHIAWLPADDMPAAWAAADVSCYAMSDHPLFHGTIPARLFESLASGTPVAAAGAGEAANIIVESGAGLAVGSGEVEALSAAILRLLDDNALRARCAQAGRAWAEANCDVEATCRYYEQVLAAVARKG